MPRLRRRVDDVPLVGDKERNIANQEFILPFENEPRFRPSQMVMTSIVRRGRFLRRRIAANDVDDADVDEPAGARVAQKLILIALRLLGSAIVRL